MTVHVVSNKHLAPTFVDEWEHVARGDPRYWEQHGWVITELLYQLRHDDRQVFLLAEGEAVIGVAILLTEREFPPHLSLLAVHPRRVIAGIHGAGRRLLAAVARHLLPRSGQIVCTGSAVREVVDYYVRAGWQVKAVYPAEAPGDVAADIEWPAAAARRFLVTTTPDTGRCDVEEGGVAVRHLLGLV